MQMLRFVGVITAGGILGALFVSIVTHLLNIAADSPLLHDGQYVMIFMATVPIGWAFGAAVAAGLMQGSGVRPPRAGLMAGLLIITGIIAGPFMGIAGVRAFGILCRLWHPHG